MIPRDYQESAIASIFKYFADGGVGNPIVLMPTGTGKSIVIGEFVKRTIQQWPHTKMMMLTHVKELISQNQDKLLKVWPLAPVGVYSAGLGKKETFYPVTFGGVSSVAKAKNFSSFGKIDLLLIDECHLVSPNDATQYNKIIKALKKINPELKVIGFTATDFRVGHGKLTENDHLFTDVCIDMTSLEGFNWFIEQGYLVPLIPKRPRLQIDISQVRMRGGEYIENEAQAAMDKHEITRAAIDEMLEYGAQRRRWLIFTQGVNHAEHVHEMLIAKGVNATVVHSKLGKEQRDAAINGFKIGYYDVIVNNGILTTGFDCPEVDLIGVLRLTQSPGLWVQILGRGTRPLYKEGFDLSTKAGRLAAIANSEKKNCLVLDFAGNTKRLGPINNPMLPKHKSGGGGGLAPIKVCEICMCYNHASVRYCKECGTEFIAAVKIQKHAGTENLVAENSTKELDSTIFNVDKVTYKAYTSKNTFNKSLKVTYYCGLRNFVEYICLEHKGYPLVKARNWWRDASLESQKPCPVTIEGAVEKLNTLKQAKRIRVLVKETNSEIINYEY